MTLHFYVHVSKKQGGFYSLTYKSILTQQILYVCQKGDALHISFRYDYKTITKKQIHFMISTFYPLKENKQKKKQKHLPLKNNLFHFSSAYILSSFSVSSFLVCIYFSSFFFLFFLHHILC